MAQPTLTMGLKDRFGLSQRQMSGEEELPAGVMGDPTHELKAFRRQHKWDPFLDNEKLDTIDDALASENVEKQAVVDETLIQEDSPYPEVRASVRFLASPGLFDGVLTKISTPGQFGWR